MSQRRRSPRTPSPKAPAAPRERPVLPDWVWAAAVFAAALLVRLGVGAQLAGEPLFRSPQLDSLEYLVWAQRIAAGELLWPVPPPHGLGYPVFLGGLLALLDGSLAAVRVAQSLLGAGSCVLAAALAGRAFGRPAGIAAGLLLALYGPLVWIDVSLLGEGLLVFLLLLATWTATAGRARAPVLSALAAGAVLAAAFLVRPTAAALLPALLAAMVAGRLRERRAWMAAGLLVLSFVLVAAPVVWKISQTNGTFIPVQGHGGYAFYIGNHPDGDGLPSPRLGRGWELLVSEAARAGLSDPAAQDRYYLDKALAAMRRRPLESLGLFASKALWLVQAAEVRDSHSYEFFRSRSALLRTLPGFGLLFPLAVCGLGAAVFRRRLPPPALLLALAGLAGLTILTMVGSRYRIPLVPFLAVFAGHGLVAAWMAGRARRLRELGVLAGLFLAAAALAHVRSYPPSRNFAEEWALSGRSLENLEDFAGAHGAYERSLAADPGYVPAWEGIGRSELKQGDLAAAETALRRALELDPESQRALYYRAVLRRQQGRLDEAVRDLRASLVLVPDDIPALHTLGEILLARGELDEAAGLFRRVLEENEQNAQAWLALARIAGAGGQVQEGIEAARRASALAPGNAEAWLVLARLALDAGDAATAEAALQRVDPLIGRQHPQVAASWALLYRLQGRHAEAAAILRSLGVRP